VSVLVAAEAGATLEMDVRSRVEAATISGRIITEGGGVVQLLDFQWNSSSQASLASTKLERAGGNVGD
jgi:hypothetical protein